jgi:serine/threonine protein kinase
LLLVLLTSVSSSQGSLRDALDRSLLSGISGWPLPAVVLSLAHDVASALLHLHEGGIVHGDIKASNVLLTWAGAGGLKAAGLQWNSVTAKVADFGLALLLGPSDTHATHYSRVSNMTVSNCMQGLAYLRAFYNMLPSPRLDGGDVFFNVEHKTGKTMWDATQQLR